MFFSFTGCISPVFTKWFGHVCTIVFIRKYPRIMQVGEENSIMHGIYIIVFNVNQSIDVRLILNNK